MNIEHFNCIVEGCNATTHIACPHSTPISPYFVFKPKLKKKIRFLPILIA